MDVGNDGIESGYDSSCPPSTPSTVSPSPVPAMRQTSLPPLPPRAPSSKRKAPEQNSSQLGDDIEPEPSQLGGRKSRKLTSLLKG